MNYSEFIIQYNGFLLLFSAVGFLFSLIWFLITEKNKRKSLEKNSLDKNQLFDEKVFFGEFDNLENPAFKEKDLKPIFEPPTNANPQTPTLEKKNESKISNANSEDSKTPKFIKMNDLPKFPTLKKGNDDKEVQGILKKIKKDIKNRKN
jgi:hypothetical protein